MIFILFKMLRFACWDYYDKLKNEIYSIFLITKEQVTYDQFMEQNPILKQ